MDMPIGNVQSLLTILGYQNGIVFAYVGPSMTTDRDNAGQYQQQMTRDDILQVFEDVEGPAIMTSDLASHLECTPETARKRLQRLDDLGVLESRTTGGRNLYWRKQDDSTWFEPIPGDIKESDQFFPDPTMEVDWEQIVSGDELHEVLTIDNFKTQKYFGEPIEGDAAVGIHILSEISGLTQGQVVEQFVEPVVLRATVEFLRKRNRM